MPRAKQRCFRIRCIQSQRWQVEPQGLSELLSLHRPLWRHRPKLALYCSSEIVCGQDLVAVVKTIVKSPVQTSALRATLVGYEEARFGSGEYVRRASKRAPELSVEVFGPARLAAGVHEHQFRLPIPGDFAPSYTGQRCSTRYYLKLHLGLHRWFGRKCSFEIALGLAEGLSTYPGRPAIFASRSGGPEAKKPYVEGSLAQDVVAPGDILRGAVALSNTSYNRYSRVVVALVGTESLHDKRTREDLEVRRLTIEIDTKEPAEGESFVLAMHVPDNLAPSAHAQLWSLSWILEIVAKVRLGRDVSVRLPVTVVPVRNLEPTSVVRAPPTVGSARMRALWHGIAKEMGLEYQGSEMTGVQAQVSVRISREHRGRKGWLVLAQLRYASLRLEARIEEASLLRGTSFGGLKMGPGTWRKDHHVRCARLEQGEAFFAELEAAVTTFTSVTMDDEELVVLMEDSGMRAARLREFVTSVLRLAETLAAARVRIPVPAPFAPHESAWLRFAGSLAGRLEPGDMSIRGQLQGVSVETDHQWSSSGELSESALRLRGLVRIEERHCYELQAAGDDGLVDSDFSDRSDSEQQALSVAALGARRLLCDRDQLLLVLGPTPAPSAFVERLPSLLRLALSRAGGVGPYR